MVRKLKLAEEIDKMVGSKIKGLRLSLGMSGAELAIEIGVAPQQLHKYERAINRISAGRMVVIARALNKPVSYFFEDIENYATLPSPRQRMCIEVSRNFMKIKKPRLQAALNDMARILAEEDCKCQ